MYDPCPSAYALLIHCKNVIDFLIFLSLFEESVKAVFHTLCKKYIFCCFFSGISCLNKMQKNGFTHLLFPGWIISLFSRCPNKILNLPLIQRAAVHVLTGDHISHILDSLHWLPIQFRIEFKILVLTNKTIHGQSPSNLKELIVRCHLSRTLLFNIINKYEQQSHV